MVADTLSQCIKDTLCRWPGVFTSFSARKNGQFREIIECLKFCIAMPHATTLNEGQLPDKRRHARTSFPPHWLTFIRRLHYPVEPKATHK